MKKLKAKSPVQFVFCSIVIAILISGCPVNSGVDENGEKINISPAGGEYSFSNGITVSVPAGAVAVDQEIGIILIEKTDAQIVSILEERGISSDDLIACIEATPDGLVFSKPILIKIPVEIDPGAFPFIHDVDLDNGTYTPSSTDIVLNPDEGTLQITVDHFSTRTAEQIEELRRGEEYCAQNPCKCGIVEITQSDNDQVCDNTNCQVTQSTLTVKYPGCNGALPPEVIIYSELSAGCLPKLTLEASDTSISPGGQAVITAKVELACGSIEDQPVDFSVSGLGQLDSTSGVTSSDGQTTATFGAGGEEGTATITATATVKYASYFIYAADAEGNRELTDGPEITKVLTKTIDVEIKETIETWRFTLDVQGNDVVIPTANAFQSTISSYHALMEFEIEVESSDMYISLSDMDITGTGTQEVGAIEVARLPTSSWGACWLESVNAPGTFPFTLYDYGHINRNANEGEFSIIHPSWLTGDSFFSWTTGIDIGTSTISMDRDFAGFQAYIDGNNQLFPVRLEDGYSISGDVYPGCSGTQGLHYTLTITDLTGTSAGQHQ